MVLIDTRVNELSSKSVKKHLHVKCFDQSGSIHFRFGFLEGHEVR